MAKKKAQNTRLAQAVARLDEAVAALEEAVVAGRATGGGILSATGGGANASREELEAIEGLLNKALTLLPAASDAAGDGDSDSVSSEAAKTSMPTVLPEATRTASTDKADDTRAGR